MHGRHLQGGEYRNGTGTDLTPKQKAFADYYIELGNATEAAIKAGYKKDYAGTNADKLLKNTKIASYIADRVRPTEKKRIATGDEVMEFFSAVMRGEIKDAFDLPPSLADRKDAAKELAKRTVDIESRKASVDIIQNMMTVAELLTSGASNRTLGDFE